jgi:hypothetical protein
LASKGKCTIVLPSDEYEVEPVIPKEGKGTKLERILKMKTPEFK